MASRAEEKERAREARLASEAADAQSARRRTAVLRLGLVLGLAVVVVVVAVLVSSSGGSSNTSTSGSGGGGKASDAAAVQALFSGIPQKGVTLGDGSAKATLIEFADLQCPYCGEYARNAMPSVVKDYVRTGKLRYELRLRSFLGDDSVTAAGGAAAATRENKLYDFAELFYQRQGQEGSGYVTDAFLRSIATGAGANPDKVVAASHAANSEPLVAEAEKKASDLGSTSTPDFFLRLAGGRLVKVSPTDLTGPAMKKALDAALAQT